MLRDERIGAGRCQVRQQRPRRRHNTEPQVQETQARDQHAGGILDRDRDRLCGIKLGAGEMVGCRHNGVAEHPITLHAMRLDDGGARRRRVCPEQDPVNNLHRACP
jgi:hypothetical protein